MESRCGNATLGEINEMLVSFVGKDMYIHFWGTCHKDSIDAYKKRLKRLFKEEDSDFLPLSLVDEDSISRFVFETILPKLSTEYSLSNDICDFMRNFVQNLYAKFTKNETPILDYCLNFDFVDITEYQDVAKQKYQTAFEKIGTKFQSLKCFRELFENEEIIKNSINKMKGQGENPTWDIMKSLLERVTDDKPICSLLIDAYVLSNIYVTLHNTIKRDSIIKNLQYNATDFINMGIKFYFYDYGYNKDERKASDILKLIELDTPAYEFYCNWFSGFQSVAKGELDKAKEYYKKAFVARRFAGCQFERFIKQAFALLCYADFNADKVRDSAVSSKSSTSPLSPDAKRYWTYGCAVGIFENKVDETHQIIFHKNDNFLKYFNPKMFPQNSELLNKIVTEQPNTFTLPSNDEKTFRDEYDRLSRLTETGVNKRIKMCGNHPTKNLPIVVALFCVENCYSFGYNDLAQRFVELINRWLRDYDNLDFALTSDKGCSIVCDAIQQYKFIMKQHYSELDTRELKQIVLTIIDRSNEESLTKKSFKRMRCALQEAIESCDMDIVKSVVYKLGNIDLYRISEDELSPVYFAINRYIELYRYKNDRELRPEEVSEHSMLWRNLDVPGLTTEDKVMQMKKWESKTELWNAVKDFYMRETYGKEDNWEAELNRIKDVCIYLIKQTKNQDGFQKKDKDMIFTSLLYAAESDNAEICRELIKHGANPNLNPPYTFLHRCIYWNSWTALAMYMEEFPEKAKKDINGEFGYKFFILFINKMKQEMEEGKRPDDDFYVKRITELFMNYKTSFNL